MADYNSFDTKPQIMVLYENEEKPFLLLNNVSYLSAHHNGQDTYRICIDAGYTWNGANIPRFLWRLIGSQYDPQYLEASMVHDWLCENKGFIIKKGARISSDIFRDILVLCGVSKCKANIMSTAVYYWQLMQGGWN